MAVCHIDTLWHRGCRAPELDGPLPFWLNVHGRSVIWKHYLLGYVARLNLEVHSHFGYDFKDILYGGDFANTAATSQIRRRL